MVEIKEYKRDDSKDYLNILKALNEIPFPVGKKLLIDFLKGNLENNSINKNKLFDLRNFGNLEILEENKIEELIDKLIGKKLIDLSPSFFNKFMKVLSITSKGQEELINPVAFLDKGLNKNLISKTEISDSEIRAFKELDDFLGDLNLEQRKAVVSNKEEILCVAGAGTGKTSVLTKRIEFLNKMKKVRGEKILAITFTRKAKKEMKKRLENMGVKVVVETFNSFCEKILLKNGGRIYGKKVRVATYQDKVMGVLKALENMEISIQEAIEKYFSKTQRKNKSVYQLQNMFVNDCFQVLEFYKSTRKNLEDFSKRVDSKHFENAKMIYSIVKYLEGYMSQAGLRTYTDQINDVLYFFERNQKYIPKFEHILVDEFQDVNSQQVKLLNLLDAPNYFYVGDPRQSIFGWRGSNVKYIWNLLKKGIEVINLRKNYRSNKHIVNLMNTSILEFNLENLTTDIVGEREIKLCKFESENVEFEYVYKKILISKNKRNEIFVLARTNKQLENFSNFLKKMKIKHILKNEYSKNILPKEDEIVLSTIHSIKGLEAEEVYVIGCTRNNFPCRASEHPVMELVKMYDYDKDEEEKRLFYVAISRAKNKLYLTYSGKNCTFFINDKMKEHIDELNFDS